MTAPSAPGAIELTLLRPGLWLTELWSETIDVRGAVIIGEQRALVWDTLSHPRDMTPVRDLLAGKPALIVYSHADWDHVWGSAGLVDASAAATPVIAHDLCRARFADPTDVAATLAEFRNKEPGVWDEVTLIPPTLTFGGGLTIDLGGVVVELHHLPGHTPDCLVAFVPSWAVLLAGDTVETPFPIVNDGTALRRWIELLQQWADDPRVEAVIPCHGELGDRRLIERNIAYLSSLTDETSAVSETAAVSSATHAANVEKARAAMPPSTSLRPLHDGDRPWVREFLAQQWGSEMQIVRGQAYYPGTMPGFLAERDGALVGLVTYEVRGEACEIMTLNSLAPGQGIGQMLLDTVADVARDAGCQQLVVVTTNDNTRALRTYQRHGFVWSSVRINALDQSRRLKPEIPERGEDDILLRDEIELVLPLSGAPVTNQ